MLLTSDNFDTLWLQLGHALQSNQAAVAYPRGYETRELIGVSLHLRDAYNNILCVSERNCNYRFMVAEWLWMTFGRNDVATIKQYNSRIADFSDDGETFDGAYGVPLISGVPYAINALRKDRDTRQAVIPIFRIPTKPTRDVPCTISLQFIVRNDRLHVIANMRSSDLWLGLPYDVFNFTMIGNMIAGEVNATLGSFTINIGSSHVYVRDLNKLVTCTSPDGAHRARSPQLPGLPPRELEERLVGLDVRVSPPWEHYANALIAPTWRQSLVSLARASKS